MGTDSGQAGHSGWPAENGGGAWQAPSGDPLSKGASGASWGDAPTSPGSPVGPPPTAPGGPQPAPAYGAAGYGPQDHPPGYGPPHGHGHPYGSPYGGHGGYGQPGPGWGGPPLPQGTATASMVLGIVGLILVVTCWGAFLGIFVAPVALGLGVSARRKADRGEGGGRSHATSGFVMGIVGTVLSVLVAAALIVGIVLSENAESGTGGTYGGDYQDALRVPAASVVSLSGR